VVVSRLNCHLIGDRKHYDQSMEVLWHTQRKSPSTTNDHDENVKEHKSERHHACRAVNHPERLQGDTKSIGEKAKMRPKEERHHVDQGQIRRADAYLYGRQLPKLEAVDVGGDVCCLDNEACWCPWPK